MKTADSLRQQIFDCMESALETLSDEEGSELTIMLRNPDLGSAVKFMKKRLTTSMPQAVQDAIAKKSERSFKIFFEAAVLLARAIRH